MPKPKNKSVDPFVQVTFSNKSAEDASDSATPTNHMAVISTDEAPKVLQWSEPETRLLLKVMSIIYTPMFQCKESRIRGIMYDKAFAFFRQKLEQDKIASDTFRVYVTKTKMKDKWTEMKKTFHDMYMTAISNNSLNAHPRKKWPYFDDMAEILKQDKSAFPHISPLNEQAGEDQKPPLTFDDVIDKGSFSSDLYTFRHQLEEQVVHHPDCTLKKSAKPANTKKNSPCQQTTMIETPAQAPAPAHAPQHPPLHYTDIAPPPPPPPPGYMHFFQMVDAVREANREHIGNTRALFDEMQMRTASERLKRKADMDEFENRYLARRRLDEDRMNRLLSSQREIIDIVQGLLGRRDDRG